MHETAGVEIHCLYAVLLAGHVLFPVYFPPDGEPLSRAIVRC